MTRNAELGTLNDASEHDNGSTMQIRIKGLMGAMLAAGLVATVAYAADVFAQLGIDQETAKGAAVQAALNASRPYYGSHAFKLASPSTRASIVRDALIWAKAFTTTSAFTTEYARLRQAEVPTAPKDDPPYAEQLKQKRADFEKTATAMEALAARDPKSKKEYDDMVAQTRAQLDAIAKDPQRMKTMQEAVDRGNAERRAEYAKDVETFKQEHPADPKQAVIARLKLFVDTCSTVDFNAKVTTAGRFANPAYENKSQDWKLCYRAGREPVEAGVAFARSWLKELGS